MSQPDEDPSKILFEEEPELEDEGETIWLISYSDLMTLLFAFFVLLYTSAIKGGGDLESVRENIAKAFGGEYENSLEDLRKEIVEAVEDEELLYDVETQMTIEGLELTFATTVLFNTGQADIRMQALRPLKKLIKVIKDEAPGNVVKVEGHTDDRPINTSRFPSNWELSGARASTIVRLFSEEGFNPSQMSATGYGESRPRVPNRSPSGTPILENMDQNRRVVIKIIAPKFKPKPKKKETKKSESA